ncbi:MAG: LacI family DNA-binding transcriptional regulator [Chloroflexota bacterium]
MNKRPTLSDVAKLADVSKATAARVVNKTSDKVRPETRDRVLMAVQKLGYEPDEVARSLRSKRTYTIAVSIPDITQPFWPLVVRGIQDTAEAAGYRIVLMNSDWDTAREELQVRQMRHKRFDGLIISPTTTQNTDLLKLSVPVVLLASGESFPDFDTVGSDSVQAARLAMEHLIELNHRRIGLLTGPTRRRKAHTHRDTYIRELKSFHIPFDPSLVIETPFSYEGGIAGMEQLLALGNRPTAVFAANDMIALGALCAAERAGLRVPEQMSIIGMDDIFAASTTCPPLTTVAKPRYDMGVTAARFLFERIADTPIADARHPLIPCKLVLRSTTHQPA